MTHEVSAARAPQNDSRGVDLLRDVLGNLLRDDTERVVIPDGLERAFLGAARRHRVVVFLWSRRARLEISEGLETHLHEVAREERIACLGMAQHLRSALRTLSDGGVKVLVIKGLALAAQTQSDFAGRGSGDLDLLVSPKSVARAWRLLVADGWQPTPRFPTPGPSWAWRHTLENYYELQLVGVGNSVDLHWHLGPVRSSFPVFDDLWARREYVDVAGLSVPTLSRMDALVHSCMHAAKDDWSLLRGLVDLKLLMANCDPKWLESCPRSTQLSAIVLDDHFGLERGTSQRRHVARARRLQAGTPQGRPYVPGLGTAVSIRRLARDASSVADFRRVAASTLAFPGLLGEVRHESRFLAALQVASIRTASVISRLRRGAGSAGRP